MARRGPVIALSPMDSLRSALPRSRLGEPCRVVPRARRGQPSNGSSNVPVDTKGQNRVLPRIGSPGKVLVEGTFGDEPGRGEMTLTGLITRRSLVQIQPPPLFTLVLRATLHRRDAVTSTFSIARSGYPQVSRAFFSNAYQLCPRLHRAGGAPMAADDQHFRGGPFERPFGCIRQPMARHRRCPTQQFLVPDRAGY
jgi:hypothetical protein